MRALTFSAHGGPERIEVRDDLPTPELQSDTDVRVRVRAAALNHLDLFALEGLPGVTITPPWIVGTDAAGVVESVGSAVSSVKVGDHVIVNPGLSDGTCAYCRAGEHPLCLRYRVLGEHVPGTAAELLVLPERNVRVIPRNVEWSVAAAFPLATLTAWRMLHTRAMLRPGEKVLIWGIGGGVALACLQIARQHGAEVWVTSTSDAKLEKARSLGANHVLRTDGDVARQIRSATGKAGVDVVVDNVGEATWEQSLLALGKGGRLVTCGATSGPIVNSDVRRIFWNRLTILGSTMGNDAEFDAITEELRAGRLRPPVDSVHSLENGRRGYERLASGEQFGKVVIAIDD